VNEKLPQLKTESAATSLGGYVSWKTLVLKMPNQRYNSFSEFWPFYVAEHSKSGTRLLHLVGTTAGICCVIFFIASGRWWLFPLALVPGYGGAWIGHFLIEKNKPATFEYPLWSFIADWKMWAMMLVGKMGMEVNKARALAK